jgi:hypothetical protein
MEPQPKSPIFESAPLAAERAGDGGAAVPPNCRRSSCEVALEAAHAQERRGS